jgi:hypothetical protein
MELIDILFLTVVLWIAWKLSDDEDGGKRSRLSAAA